MPTYVNICLIFSLRTSETNYLNEAFSFYAAIRGRAYYSRACREDRYELSRSVRATKSGKMQAIDCVSSHFCFFSNFRNNPTDDDVRVACIRLCNSLLQIVFHLCNVSKQCLADCVLRYLHTLIQIVVLLSLTYILKNVQTRLCVCSAKLP
jgi:hypothetical protein